MGEHPQSTPTLEGTTCRWVSRSVSSCFSLRTAPTSALRYPRLAMRSCPTPHLAISPDNSSDQVPKNLEERDIQEAFEDIGRVTKCEAISWAGRTIHPKHGEIWVEAGWEIARGCRNKYPKVSDRSLAWQVGMTPHGRIIIAGGAWSGDHYLCQLLSCQEGLWCETGIR